MITVVAGDMVIDGRKVDTEFDDRWVLLYDRALHNSEAKWRVAAYGDGTPEDRDALREYCFDRFKGKALLTKGFTPKNEEYVLYGMYDC